MWPLFVFLAKAQTDSLSLACLGRVLWQKHSALRSVVPLAVFVLCDISCSVIDISSLDILSPKKQSLPPGQLHNAQSTTSHRLSSFFVHVLWYILSIMTSFFQACWPPGQLHRAQPLLPSWPPIPPHSWKPRLLRTTIINLRHLSYKPSRRRRNSLF